MTSPRVRTIFFSLSVLLALGVWFGAAAPAAAQGGQGLGQLGPLPFKDLDCDGYEDLTGLNMLGNVELTRSAWKLLCPGKVDQNCDGRSDQNGGQVYKEPHFERQCPGGYSTAKKDVDCDGFDDRYPWIEVRKTDYWSRSCPDPDKYKDADCDGYDDVIKDDLLRPASLNYWRSLCPGKVDRNCDGRSDLSGIRLTVDDPKSEEELRDRALEERQCPNGFGPRTDSDCSGFDDAPVGYQIVPDANGVPRREPVYLDITNTDYWKAQCRITYSSQSFLDADCDGKDDRINIPLLTNAEWKEAWQLLCPGKVDLNCDGRADISGSRFSGGIDSAGKQVELINEPHFKYQCPKGHSIQNRDLDCDGIDDAQAEVVRTTIDPTTGDIRTERQFLNIDISNTDYWKTISCKEVQEGVIGSRPLQDGPNAEFTKGGRAYLDCSQVRFRFDDFTSIVCTIRNLVAYIFIPFAFIVATLVFTWGVIRYVIRADSDEARSQGKRFMLWGIVAMFVLFAMWGIVRLAADTLGFEFKFPPQLREK